MKQATCNHCSDTVCVPERGERVINGETPMEHFERAGHAYNSPETRVCNDCEYVWPYTGKSDQPTCPNCKGKRTESTD